MDNEQKTFFASPQRDDLETVKYQSKILVNNSLVEAVINSMPNFVLILNMNRQIIFANRSFLNSIGHDNVNQILGKRPGETLNCAHSNLMEAGCGTSEFCRTCGAVQAIIESQNLISSMKECRISLANGDALDFSVWANPLFVDGNQFTIFAVIDISADKRKKALERIFFHDILNTAGGLRGFVELLNDASESELKELVKNVNGLSEQLIDELKAQVELLKAENNELEVHLTSTTSLLILSEMKMTYSNHVVANGKSVIIDTDSMDEKLITDRGILRRTLGNLIKNALEASNRGDAVILKCTPSASGNNIIFSVYNKGFIPRNIQLQIFQRSFSTKDASRGLGTYSIKLLTERYLKGRIWFETDEIKGTTFFVSITVPNNTTPKKTS